MPDGFSDFGSSVYLRQTSMVAGPRDRPLSRNILPTTSNSLITSLCPIKRTCPWPAVRAGKSLLSLLPVHSTPQGIVRHFKSHALGAMLLCRSRLWDSSHSYFNPLAAIPVARPILGPWCAPVAQLDHPPRTRQTKRITCRLVMLDQAMAGSAATFSISFRLSPAGTRARL